MMKKLSVVLCLMIACLSVSGENRHSVKETLDRGTGSFEYSGYEPLSDKPLTVYYYIPPEGDIRKMRILFVMTGAEREAKPYVPVWQHFAENKGFIVIVPEFTKKLYNENAYQFGGVSVSAKKFRLKPEKEWTYQLIESLFDHIKSETGNESNTYDMFGHSAGGQFVHRFLLAMPHARVGTGIAANPGSWTFPLKEGITDPDDNVYGWPYSVKDTPFASKKYLAAFFEKKLIVQAGTADTATSGKYVPVNAPALAQGAYRYERALNFFRQSRETAQKMNCPFNWQLVEVPGAGHSNRRMIHGKADIKTVIKDGVKIYSINDISELGAYYLLFEK